MRDGTLPAAMALAMVGLMLGFFPRRVAVIGTILAAFVAIAASTAPLTAGLGETMIVFSCIMVAVCSVPVYWPRPLPEPVALGLSGMAGLAAGLTLAAASSSPRAYLALLGLLSVLPAIAAVERGYRVAPRVVASWLLAVALLAAILPYVIAHPGYVPDHRG